MKNPVELQGEIRSLQESLEQKERIIAAFTDHEQKSIHSSSNNGNVLENNIFFQKEVARQIKRLKALTEEAESSNKSKSHFLATMSHEVRTPMNAIIGLSRLALKTNIQSERYDYLTKINTAAENLLRIINDILDFSRIEAGKIQLENRPFLLPEVFKQVKSIVEEKVAEKGLKFISKIDFILEGEIIGDSTRLQQILINLVNNAVKFTEQGQICLVASVLHRKEDWLTIQFSVKDSGVGFSEEVRRTIFASYNQADSSIARRFGGTGLGLSIVRELVHLMGGTIQVKSKLDEGSEFYFSLDFGRDREQSALHVSRHDSSLSSEENDVLQGARVLLVEDNLINQDVASAMLSQKGMLVTIAENGQEAIDMVAENDYDCVLMDIQMPIMDGITATRILRKDERFIHLPILAMTANALVDDVKRSLDAGMNCHISKPINVGQLYREMIHWIRHSKSDKAIVEKKEGVKKNVTKLPSSDPSPQDMNMREALERVGGNKELFLRILVTFLEQHARDYTQVKLFLDQNNREAAKKIIHSLKGVALVVGSKNLHTTVREIDAILTGGLEDDLTLLLEEFKENLEDAVRSIKDFISQNKTEQDLAGQPVKKTNVYPLHKPRVLVVDDEEISIRLLADILEEECQVMTSMDGKLALQLARKEPLPALILLDVTMPSMDGFELCEALKHDPITRDIPVIFITSRDEENDEIKGFDAGAVDYIYKPIRKAIVLARIKLHLELKQERDFHARRSLIDGLTEIPNRRRLMEHLSHELRRAQRSKSFFTLIMLDIDFFKLFNDNYGHLRGDEALKLVAEVVFQKMQRPNDLVGRYGGEEFVCVLPETDAVGAVEMCRLLLEVVSELHIPHDFSTVSDVLTISLGAVTTVPDKESTAEELLMIADDLLYKSKKGGRNRYTCKAV